MGLWDHMDSIWTYRNNKYQKNTNQQARYKIEALDRRYDEIVGETCGPGREASCLSNETV
jgi:hypothetical protein